MAPMMPQAVISAIATQKLSVSPMSTRNMTVRMPARMSASVRRLKNRRTRGTVSPPTICEPATTAANRPVRWLMLAAPFTVGVGFYAFYALQPYLLELYGDPNAYGVAGLAEMTVRTAVTGVTPRSGVKPRSCMNHHATTSVTPSSAARTM